MESSFLFDFKRAVQGSSILSYFQAADIFDCQVIALDRRPFLTAFSTVVLWHSTFDPVLSRHVKERKRL